VGNKAYSRKFTLEIIDFYIKPRKEMSPCKGMECPNRHKRKREIGKRYIDNRIFKDERNKLVNSLNK